MPSMTEMPGGSGDPESAILFPFWTVYSSVSNGKGISVWIVSADADSADITSGGSSVSMSTVVSFWMYLVKSRTMQCLKLKFLRWFARNVHKIGK